MEFLGEVLYKKGGTGVQNMGQSEIAKSVLMQLKRTVLFLHLTLTDRRQQTGNGSLNDAAFEYSFFIMTLFIFFFVSSISTYVPFK